MNGFPSELACLRQGEAVADSVVVVVPGKLRDAAMEAGRLEFSGVMARTEWTRESKERGGKRFTNYETRLVAEKIQKFKAAA